jgi:uncharacterized protein YndB with AHSA1/START domain
MNNYKCNVSFNASPSTVYYAITNPEGLRGWWTSDCDVGSEIGSRSTFRFGEAYNVMRIEKPVPGEELRQ